VAGEGEFLEEARAYAQAHGHDAVTFLGNVEGAEKEQLLRKCHVLLFPTYYGEGLPNAILECMLNGMVVISRPAGGIGEVVEHGVHGYLSTSVESRVFAGFLGALIENEDLMARMARTNLETALQRFTADHVRERILALYRLLLTDRASGQPSGAAVPSGVLPATVNQPIENNNA
jgi:glycosyltransferase involved in cell wall biosynthesis